MRSLKELVIPSITKQQVKGKQFSSASCNDFSKTPTEIWSNNELSAQSCGCFPV